MLKSLSLCASAAALIAAPSFAQAYKTVGSGCGTPGAATFSEKTNTGTVNAQNLTNEYAYPVNIAATRRLVVTGVRFYTRSISGHKTIAVRLYKPSATNKAQPDPTAIDTATMTVGPKDAFWQASFNKVHLMTGPFWIGMDCVEVGQTAAAVYASNITGGKKTITTVYWRRPPATGTWAATGIVKWPAYEVLSGGSAPGILSSKTPPTIGKNFQLDLAQGGTGPVVGVFGFNNKNFGPIILPADLKVVAPGCWLFQSLDLLIPTASSSANGAKVTLPIPNDTKLKGVKFYNQWMLFKRGGNALNWTFSNSGEGTIG